MTMWRVLVNRWNIAADSTRPHIHKILLLAYDYPPRGWSGVQRTVKFVRYMPEFGWDPVVVAPSEWFRPAPPDPTLLGEVSHAPTIRTPCLTEETLERWGRRVGRGLRPLLRLAGKSERWVAEGVSWRLESCLFPDPAVGWLPYAVRYGLRAVQAYQPEMIYATAPPYSTLISGMIVAKLSRRPLVVDLRDLWTDNPMRKVEGGIKQRLDRTLERMVLRSAAVILTTSESAACIVAEKYPAVADRVFTIFNGYDRADFDGLAPPSVRKPGEGPLNIAHVGSLYGDRSPEPFLEAVARTLGNGRFCSEDLQIRFVGETSAFRELFDRYEYLHMVRADGPVDHWGALEAMVDSDVLLLIAPEQHKMVIPGKIFEYMAAGRPIFGVVPRDGDVARLLRNAGHRWVAHYSDVEAIARCLDEMLGQWKGGRELRGAEAHEKAARFERRRLTRELCEILGEAVRGSGNSRGLPETR